MNPAHAFAAIMLTICLIALFVSAITLIMPNI